MVPVKLRAMQPDVVAVPCVTVAMKATQQVVDIGVKAADETDGFRDALLYIERFL